MAKVKTYSTDLEFIGELPGKPGDGYLAGLQRTATQTLGVLVNSGWSFRGATVEATEQAGRYKLRFPLHRRGQRRFEADSAAAKAVQIQDKLVTRLPGWKKIGDDSSDTQKEYTVAELLKFPDNINSYFDHLYNREIHVREILDSIQLARDTDMRMRQHILLHGYPASAKTKLMMIIHKIFGDVAVRKLDATSLTKSGAEKLLLDATPVPPILLIDEIEKTAEVNLSWLLAVLDERAELIKTTARMDVSRLTRCLCIASANNVDKLKNYQEGAIWSRFQNKLYCSLPDEELLRKILHDEINNIPNGKEAWIEPALEYGLKTEKTYDARRILAIMALGKDRLLTGEYQDAHNDLRTIEHSDSNRISEYNLGGM